MITTVTILTAIIPIIITIIITLVLLCLKFIGIIFWFLIKNLKKYCIRGTRFKTSLRKHF